MDSIRKNTLNFTNDGEFTTSYLHLKENQLLQTQDLAPDEMSRRLNLLLEAINETAAENEILNKNLSKFLASLDLEPQQLSKEITQGLDKIQAIIQKENLSEIDETSMLINLHQKKIDELKKIREERQLKKKYEDLYNEYSLLQEKLNTLQGKVNNLTEIIVSSKEGNESESSNIIHKTTKLNDYKCVYKSLEDELANLKVTEDYAQNILGKYKQYMQTSGELADINESLSQYGDLPADILQAKAVVEQLEKRRQEVKRLLDEKMN
ncbi:protein NETWORKED 1B-like [Chelonus insularis]|uniref:protein NETWORKED 1B-like n=1 Tax=Chelonus insularis TaxID=460826 RepID=UPI00158E1C4A|nr:protein NETWORKED 1B-like [Chelonus insularis]